MSSHPSPPIFSARHWRRRAFLLLGPIKSLEQEKFCDVFVGGCVFHQLWQRLHVGQEAVGANESTVRFIKPSKTFIFIGAVRLAGKKSQRQHSTKQSFIYVYFIISYTIVIRCVWNETSGRPGSFMEIFTVSPLARRQWAGRMRKGRD